MSADLPDGGGALDLGFDERTPRFGALAPGFVLVRRPSVYGLLVDACGRLAIVETRRGTWLPGGGVEAGESRERALVREFREECGFEIEPGELLARAVQLAHDHGLRKSYEKTSSFHRAVLVRVAGPPLELGHRLEWVEPAVARARLTSESHAWVVERWSRSDLR